MELLWSKKWICKMIFGLELYNMGSRFKLHAEFDESTLSSNTT